jgi:hypothetical protein
MCALMKVFGIREPNRVCLFNCTRRYYRFNGNEGPGGATAGDGRKMSNEPLCCMGSSMTASATAAGEVIAGGGCRASPVQAGNSTGALIARLPTPSLPAARWGSKLCPT